MNGPTTTRKLPIVLSVSLLAGLSLLSTTSAVGDDADVTVVFTPDDMGFTANSTKDISNIIVELCTGAVHKHDNLTGLTFVHSEAGLIAGVWVKSGNNGAGGSAPPGAGERVNNVGVVCAPTNTTPTSTPTPTSTSTTTSAPPTNTTTTTAPPTNTTAPPANSTAPPPATPPPEIPVFPSWTALALGVVGALGGAFAVFRRRLP